MAGTITCGTLSDGTNSTSSTNCIQGSAKAWVNFDGTVATPTIRASFNVGSITKLGTGYYTVNFTTSMPSANYAVSTAGGDATGNDPSVVSVSTSTPQTTSSVTLRTIETINYKDKPIVCVSVFR